MSQLRDISFPKFLQTVDNRLDDLRLAFWALRTRGLVEFGGAFRVRIDDFDGCIDDDLAVVEELEQILPSSSVRVT